MYCYLEHDHWAATEDLRICILIATAGLDETTMRISYQSKDKLG